LGSANFFEAILASVNKKRLKNSANIHTCSWSQIPGGGVLVKEKFWVQFQKISLQFCENLKNLSKSSKNRKQKIEVNIDLSKKEHCRKFHFFLNFIKPKENIIVRKLFKVA
jgi:hypothetical protein